MQAGCSAPVGGRHDRLDHQDHHVVDALFLNGRPGPSGMELLAELRDGPPVIFVTANAEHAVAAFEHQASDYLVKPVTADRLAKTLARLEGGELRKTEAVPAAPGTASTRFPVKAGDGKLLLELKRVAYFEVIDQVVWAWAGGKKFRCTWTSLSDVESGHFQASSSCGFNGTSCSVPKPCSACAHCPPAERQCCNECFINNR